MTVYISGGSNSELENGWVAAFTKTTPATNISIGRASTAMGAYKAIFTIDLKKGDTLIWEYAANDLNLLKIKQINLPTALRFCEYIIRHCMERGANFVPLIFIPRDHETATQNSMYRDSLNALFSHYDIPFLDVSTAFRAKLGVATIPKTYFQNNLHYNIQTDIIPFIASETTALVRKSTPLSPDITPKHLLPNVALRFIGGFSGGAPETFVIPQFTGRAWNPGPSGLQSAQFGNDGYLKCIILALPTHTDATKSTKFEIDIGNELFRLPTSHGLHGVTTTKLRAIVFPGVVEHQVQYEKGDRIKISWTRPKSHQSKVSKDARIIGVMVEEQTTRTKLTREDIHDFWDLLVEAIDSQIDKPHIPRTIKRLFNPHA